MPRRVGARTNGDPPAGRAPGRRRFFEQVRERPARGERFDAEIAGRLERELTILAADSSGFSKKTFEHGIVRFLANLARAYEGVVPIIEKHGGVVTTRNADNLLAVYRDTVGAVRAAIEVHAWLRRRNARLAAPDRFELCIGIHHGPVLRLRDDVYGAAVNVCAKIGEDVAKAGETLVTDEVVGRAAGFRYRRAGQATIGGRSVRLHRVLP